ncbi:hypothetical protein [Aulosira sp. FACHB-615]|uniref:hypothetical protein n=1 Tax=Aulosira sp. FACHB-615 TaxID=2692777 RepID=UPI0016895C7D|nr:hypothetical protein [Aulosira sp. FACHB-615]MBD2492353.1 hypothetical protein [Aulosira sp. FACHB-615]
MEIIINKIQISDNVISINYDLPCDSNQRKNVKFSCDQEASPDFYSVLNNLLEEAINTLGLDQRLWAKGTVTGVVFKDNKITITVTNKVGDIYVTVSTPSILVDAEELLTLIEKITSEAVAYIDGKRAQMSLLDNDGKVVEIRQFQMN